MAAEPSAKKRKEGEKKKCFRWTDEMHTSLIEALKDYKVSCEYNNVDFDADKTLQYKTLRKEMAKRFNTKDSPFGPVDVSERPPGELNEDEKKRYTAMVKDEKKLILQGYNRVLEKVKILRQGFSKAVTAGTRSGSGKLVYDQYDNLRNIWGGSPNTMPLPTGIDSSSVNDGELLPQDHDDSSDNDESGDLGKRFVINCFRYSVLIIRPHAGLVKIFD